MPVSRKQYQGCKKNLTLSKSLEYDQRHPPRLVACAMPALWKLSSERCKDEKKPCLILNSLSHHIIPHRAVMQSSKVTRRIAIPLGFTAAFQSPDSSSLHCFAVKRSSAHICQAWRSPTVTVKPCKRHMGFLSTGTNKRTIMDLQNLISLNRFYWLQLQLLGNIEGVQVSLLQIS